MDRETGRQNDPIADKLKITIAANEVLGAVITTVILGFVISSSPSDAGWALITFGALWAVVGKSFLKTADLRKDWLATNCEMLHIRRIRAEDARHSPWWQSQVWAWNYKYKVDGVVHRGGWASIDKPDNSAKVYYNPHHPEQSTGDKKANIGRGRVDLLIGRVLILAGAIVLVMSYLSQQLN